MKLRSMWLSFVWWQAARTTASAALNFIFTAGWWPWTYLPRIAKKSQEEKEEEELQEPRFARARVCWFCLSRAGYKPSFIWLCNTSSLARWTCRYVTWCEYSCFRFTPHITLYILRMSITCVALHCTVKDILFRVFLKWVLYHGLRLVLITDLCSWCDDWG